ncbi:MAG: tyrosine-type recombinase/integrase [Leptospirillum sp.]
MPSIKEKLRLTDTFIKKLALSSGKQEYFQDTEVLSLFLRVGKRDKVFCVIKRLKGGNVREISLASASLLTTEAARLRAKEILLDIALGKDPTQRRQLSEMQKMTLQEALDKYLEISTLKESTRQKTYLYPFQHYLPDWLPDKVTSITGDRVVNKYKELTKNNTIRTTTIQGLFRALRAVLNFIKSDWKGPEPLFTENTVSKLASSNSRLWVKQEARTRILFEHEVPLLYNYLKERLRDPGSDHIVPAYFIFVLFTGCRRNEAATLTRHDVDLENGFVTFKDTKTVDRTIPLSEPLIELLLRLKTETGGPWVFPGKGKTGHLTEPKKTLASVIKTHNMKPFCIHDLRRTFITYAKGVAPAMAVDNLVGHKTQTVSAKHYEFPTPESLREPMETITAKLLELSMNVVKSKKREVPLESPFWASLTMDP